MTDGESSVGPSETGMTGGRTDARRSLVCPCSGSEVSSCLPAASPGEDTPHPHISPRVFLRRGWDDGEVANRQVVLRSRMPIPRSARRASHVWIRACGGSAAQAPDRFIDSSPVLTLGSVAANGIAEGRRPPPARRPSSFASGKWRRGETSVGFRKASSGDVAPPSYTMNRWSVRDGRGRNISRLAAI